MYKKIGFQSSHKRPPAASNMTATKKNPLPSAQGHNQSTNFSDTTHTTHKKHHNPSSSVTQFLVSVFL